MVIGELNDRLSGWRKWNFCPYCNKKVDAATDPTDIKAIPCVGDVTVCFYCTQISQFNEKLILEKVDVTTLDLKLARRLDRMQREIMKLNWRDKA
jgi:transcription elongation factor Elf1